MFKKYDWHTGLSAHYPCTSARCGVLDLCSPEASGNQVCDDDEDSVLLDRVRTMALSGADFTQFDPLVRLYRARHMRRVIRRVLITLATPWAAGRRKYGESRSSANEGKND